MIKMITQASKQANKNTPVNCTWVFLPAIASNEQSPSFFIDLPLAFRIVSTSSSSYTYQHITAPALLAVWKMYYLELIRAGSKYTDIQALFTWSAFDSCVSYTFIFFSCLNTCHSSKLYLISPTNNNLFSPSPSWPNCHIRIWHLCILRQGEWHTASMETNPKHIKDRGETLNEFNGLWIMLKVLIRITGTFFNSTYLNMKEQCNI